MSVKSLRIPFLAGATGAAIFLGACGGAPEPAPAPASAPPAEPVACDDTGGLSLPPGFCATLFADALGHARHMAVGADGTVYVNTWSGRYYRNAPPPTGALT